MAKETLGRGEFPILASLARRPAGVHGTALIEDLRERTGREWSVGALYTTLDRLEAKGYVSSRWGEPTPERGGRRKRIFRVEGAGHLALHATAQMVNAIYPPNIGGAPVEA